MEKSPPPAVKVNLSRLEKKYKRLIERAYNLRQSDDSLSDIFYFEAEKVLTQLRLLRSNLFPN
ncbi:Lacal_2735 family protein [uncultured Planktosalinus sp.]|uniref:Lacal_2735 family protein n=1 Tax=uncultured Planktosalinus sp. TaxID=1810935 RepID=UPI0030D94176|tara:strand:- start:610 stop:798 length:189 start_codon:yes stop_codon:yes gene_type:complete